MLAEDRLERLIDKVFRTAAREGIYGGGDRTGQYRERIFSKAENAVESMRLGYMSDEDFCGIIAECCQRGLESAGVCRQWQRRLLEIEHIAAARAREIFIDSICQRPEQACRGKKIRHIEFDTA